MVARLLTRKPAFRGIRPFNAAQDMYGVAHLLEEAFRPDHNFPFANVPFLRQVGITLWTLSYAPGFPDTPDGFVWIEEGKIVGNVTLTRDQKEATRYYVSNVAVKHQYRRQGIARAMMQATIEHVRQLGGHKILLNVRPNNPGAIQLYRDLGFHALETRGEWSLSAIPSHLPSMETTGVRPLKSSDARAVSELLHAAIPEHIRSFRIERTPFELPWEEQIGEALVDFLMRQSSQRWGLERDARLAALVFVQRRQWGSPHKIAIQVHPDFRGYVEEALVVFALQKLSGLTPHAVRAEASSTQPELVNTLERFGFQFLNGLTLMELDLK